MRVFAGIVTVIGLVLLASARSVSTAGRDAATTLKSTITKRQPPDVPQEERFYLYWELAPHPNDSPFEAPHREFQVLEPAQTPTNTERRTIAFTIPELVDRLNMFGPGRVLDGNPVPAEADLSNLRFGNVVLRMEAARSWAWISNLPFDVLATVPGDPTNRLMSIILDSIYRGTYFGTIYIQRPSIGQLYQLVWGIGYWTANPNDDDDNNNNNNDSDDSNDGNDSIFGHPPPPPEPTDPTTLCQRLMCAAFDAFSAASG